MQTNPGTAVVRPACAGFAERYWPRAGALKVWRLSNHRMQVPGRSLAEYTTLFPPFQLSSAIVAPTLAFLSDSMHLLEGLCRLDAQSILHSAEEMKCGSNGNDHGGLEKPWKCYISATTLVALLQYSRHEQQMLCLPKREALTEAALSSQTSFVGTICGELAESQSGYAFATFDRPWRDLYHFRTAGDLGGGRRHGIAPALAPHFHVRSNSASPSSVTSEDISHPDIKCLQKTFDTTDTQPAATVGRLQTLHASIQGL